MTGTPADRPGAAGDPATAADLLVDAVIVVDLCQRIVQVNQAAIRLTGYPDGVLVGRHLGSVIGLAARQGGATDGGPADRAATEPSQRWPRSAYLSSVWGFPEQEVTVRTARGGQFPAFAAGRYLRDHQGGLTGAVISVRRAVRRKERSGGTIEVVSAVSHELRSPLTSIKGYSSLLLSHWDRVQDDQKQMMLEQIHHDADQVTRLMTELLDVSRLETGQLRLRRQLVDLPALVGSTIDKVSRYQPGLEALTEFPAGFPLAFADPDKIDHVLTNLIENACKYGSVKGIRIRGRVDVDRLTVSVTDTGEGIGPATLAQVFAKVFRRAEARPTGCGLGLWISKGLAEAHGGALTVESVLGQGSTFRLTLPRPDAEDRP